jgi:glycogen synthase
VAAVLNGLDAASWDPRTDPMLPRAARLGDDAEAAWKARAKALLQRRLGLRADPAAPLYAFLGRLEGQKGADVMLAALPELLAIRAAPASGGEGAAASEDDDGGAGAAQVAMLGAGQPWMERAVSSLAPRFPGRAAGSAGFSAPLARLLLAAADFLVVPSRFEPCGLVALAALRYGAVPLAASTGGLKDIVTPDVGLTFDAPGAEGDAEALRSAARALAAAAREAAAAAASGRAGEMRRAGMARDVSWNGRAAEWEGFLQGLAAARDAGTEEQEGAGAAAESGGGEGAVFAMQAAAARA